MKILGKKGEKGQSLVEFAITLPVLILILSGLLDLGRLYYTFIALEEAVAEAALYLAISPTCPEANTNPRCDNPNNAIYRAVNSGNDEFDPALAEWNIPWTAQKGADGWTEPFEQGCASIGCNVLVQVEYPFEVLTPGIQSFLDNTENTITLSTQASQIIVFNQR
ncbi:MAG: TadE family protein [Anaerolineae bacterium]